MPWFTGVRQGTYALYIALENRASVNACVHLVYVPVGPLIFYFFFFSGI